VSFAYHKTLDPSSSSHFFKPADVRRRLAQASDRGLVAYLVEEVKLFLEVRRPAPFDYSKSPKQDHKANGDKLKREPVGSWRLIALGRCDARHQIP
jgi:hypothetical protein